MSKLPMMDEDAMDDFELIGEDCKLSLVAINCVASETVVPRDEDSIHHDYVDIDKTTLNLSLIELPVNDDSSVPEHDWIHGPHAIESSTVKQMDLRPSLTTSNAMDNSHASVGSAFAPFEQMELLASATAYFEAEYFSEVAIDSVFDAHAASGLWYVGSASMIEDWSEDFDSLKHFSVVEHAVSSKFPCGSEKQLKYKRDFRARVNKTARERLLQDWIDGEFSLRKMTVSCIAALSPLRGESDTLREEVRQLAFEEHAILQDTFDMRSLAGLSTGMDMSSFRRRLHTPGCKRNHIHELAQRRTALVFNWDHPEEENGEGTDE